MNLKDCFFFIFIFTGLLLPKLSPAAAFIGTGTIDNPDANGAGIIPDSPGNGIPDYSAGPLVVSFAVTNLTTNIQDMAVSITMMHQWVGDLNIYLTSPAGTNFTIFSRVGPPGPLGYGNSADLAGTYFFYDYATNTLRNVVDGMNLDLGSGIDFTNIIPGGYYRTSATGPTNEPATSFYSNSGFVGLTPAQTINGTWTLSFLDGGPGDTGTVASATLYINLPPPPPRFTGIIATNGMLGLTLAGPFHHGFSLWRSTNLALPFASWEMFGAGTFDTNGNASFSSGITPPGFFYQITIP